jgi:murein DD-endopeptidase MepM/ murein hydrolase activator NlpD
LTFKSRRKNSLGLLFGLVLIVTVIGVGYLYLSPAFEKDNPVVDIEDSIYWNLKDKITLNLTDESGIKYYKVTFKDGLKDIILNEEVISDKQSQITVNIVPPKLDIFHKEEEVILEIEVVDNSKWNFLEGNKIVKKVEIKLDTKKPIANVLSNSRYIQRGGSAVVVVRVEDENLVDSYISFNDEKRFKLMPYKKQGYFVALLAWPIDIKKFKRINLVAIDKANNKTVTKVPVYIQKKKIKKDNIKLSKEFVKNISAFVLEQSGESVPQTLEDIFVYSNKDLRAKNLKELEDTAMKAMENQSIESFKIKPFRRLRGSKTVAGYAERRHYYLDKKKINEAWHLGIDWASVKQASIKTSNDGEVVFNSYLGLYGNSIVIDHGMGLFSLYAHTSTQKVEVGDTVSAKQIIANTGATGAVFGDHLHFGILIQGVEVNPLEWMDKNWIKVRITNILNSANKQIASK